MLFGASAIVDEYHTAKYHDAGQYFLPAERIHTYPNADGDGYDGLHVGIHAHQGRADAFLSQRDEEVGDEGGAHNQEGQFPQVGA